MDILWFGAFSAEIFWLVAFGALLLIEILTLGLTTIWFAVGALAAFLLALLHVPLMLQIVVFIVVSVLMLIFTRPVMTKYLNKKTTKTNAESLVGRNARVLIPINNLKSEGQVMVGGMEWTARSTKDEVTFQKDEMVHIVGISGVKLIVEKENKEENDL
ncbi:NfeD family protein [Frisingicoccus sp.]|jgi:membrane protein implicated in regulation of membrane protease activity|uniref:NfeD family protein n=1 Tax=Frisingicoccus sp. TaxID=1918627 RepID=UPI0015BF1903